MEGLATIRRERRSPMANRNGVSHQVYVNRTLDAALRRYIAGLPYDPGVSIVIRTAIVEHLRAKGAWAEEDDRLNEEEEAQKGKRGRKPGKGKGKKG